MRRISSDTLDILAIASTSESGQFRAAQHRDGDQFVGIANQDGPLLARPFRRARHFLRNGHFLQTLHRRLLIVFLVGDLGPFGGVHHRLVGFRRCLALTAQRRACEELAHFLWYVGPGEECGKSWRRNQPDRGVGGSRDFSVRIAGEHDKERHLLVRARCDRPLRSLQAHVTSHVALAEEIDERSLDPYVHLVPLIVPRSERCGHRARDVVLWHVGELTNRGEPGASRLMQLTNSIESHAANAKHRHSLRGIDGVGEARDTGCEGDSASMPSRTLFRIADSRHRLQRRPARSRRACALNARSETMAAPLCVRVEQAPSRPGGAHHARPQPLRRQHGR